MPIAVASVDMKGYDTEKLSMFVEDTLMNKLEGITGVASVNAGGLLESRINVTINEDKIEKLNEKVSEKRMEAILSKKSINRKTPLLCYCFLLMYLHCLFCIVFVYCLSILSIVFVFTLLILSSVILYTRTS